MQVRKAVIVQQAVLDGWRLLVTLASSIHQDRLNKISQASISLKILPANSAEARMLTGGSQSKY